MKITLFSTSVFIQAVLLVINVSQHGVEQTIWRRPVRTKQCNVELLVQGLAKTIMHQGISQGRAQFHAWGAHRGLQWLLHTGR